MSARRFHFRQRMDDLRVYTDVGDIEAHRTLVPIQIIIQTGILLHKRGADTLRRFSALPRLA